MVVQLEEALQIYREYAKYPSVVSARVSNVKTPGHINIYSQWSQRDLERNEKVKFSRSHIIQLDVVVPTVPCDVSSEQWVKESPSGKYKAVVRQVKDAKGEKKQYIEVWSDTHKVQNISVADLEQHGIVYENDGQFGCLEWSASETHLLYIAEKKEPKAKSFFDKKAAEEQESKGDSVARGDEFVYKESWGEQLVGKSCPVICVLDVESGVVSTIDNVPDDVSPGQAVWVPDDTGIVCVGWWHDPYRLGLIYCPMRRSALFHIDLKSSKCSIIGSKDMSVRSPVFSPDKTKLVFMENSVGGPHCQCSKLMMCDWSNKGIVTVVDVVRSSKGDEFPGLFCQVGLDGMGLANKRCWAADSKRVVVETYWRSQPVLVVVDVETGKVKRISNDETIGSCILADVHDDQIVAVTSSLDQPDNLILGRLPTAGSEGEITWTQLDKPYRLPEITWKVNTFKIPEKRINKDFSSVTEIEYVLVEPKLEDTSIKPPLLVYNHGGPHSVFSTGFMLYFSGICRCGFAVLLVNYRGSIGFGQDSIESLPGNIGIQDVQDIQEVAEHVLATGKFNKDKVVIAGGSHGGFLTAHMIGQYPDFYKAAVLRNPVINIATMWGTSDIPDWCHVEAGCGLHDHKTEPSAELYSKLWKCSPLKHVCKVKTPSLIMIGEGDQRVPPTQGHELRKALKSRGIPVKLLSYPNNSHPINKVDAEADAFGNIFRWFTSYV